jgi:hypothetical protein
MLLGWARPSMAQLDTGSISGVVTDSAGKVLAGAAITAKESATGTAYSTVSSSTGYYVFPSVRTGSYEVAVHAPGFKADAYTGVVVTVGASTARDITLAVGSNTETITVESGSQTLQSESSDVGVAIQPEQVEELPLTAGGFRSLETLVYLAPGVAGFGQSSSTDSIKINGGQEAGTDFLIDGITTNRAENGSGSFGIVSPSVDAVSEFHVTLSGLPAELGRTTGGVSNFNTRGGTNDYHGSVYDIFKNAALDANTWFNNYDMAQQGNTAQAKAEFKRGADTKIDLGVNLGGPIRIPHVYNGKNKSFFFFNWEQWRQNYGGPVNSLLPTPAQLGSDGTDFDFSSLLGSTPLGVSPCGETVYPGEIMDPQYDNTGSKPCRYAGFGQTVTGAPGAYVVTGSPTNKIPIGRVSTVANNIINKFLMPLAQEEVSGSTTYNYTQRSMGTIANTAYSIRIDQNLGAKNKIWGFFSSRENTDSGGNSDLPVPFQTCCSTVDQLGKFTRAGWEWIVTPTMVNSLTFGGNRSNNINKSKASQMGTNWDQELGITNGFSNDFPVFQFNGNTFGGIGQQKDSTDIDNVVAVNDILHWQHGAHSFKFGGEAQYHQYSWVSKIGGTCSGNAGCMQFWDNQTASDENYWGQDGNSFAAFLIGEAGLMSNLNDLHAPRWISHYGTLFAQDDWKLRPNLTVNLGLRWSYETPRHEADGDTSIFDPTLPDTAASGYPGALVFAGKGAGRNGSMNETWGTVYKKNFEPRVGFAWEPGFLDHKVVVHGSGGIFFGPLVYADYGQGTVQGFTVSKSLFTNDPLDGPSLDAGLAALPTTPDLSPNQLDGTSTSPDYIAKSNGRPGMTESWTMELQNQLTPNLVASLGYLGMHATRLHAMLKFFNDMPDKDMALGDWLNWWAAAPGPLGWSGPPMEPYANFNCAAGPPTCTWANGVTEAQALRPFPQVEYINMDSYLQNLGQSTYNALEARLEQRFHNGLNILASYTFSKTLTDADVIQPYWSTLQNGGSVQDPENLRGEKAVSSEDVPNNFVVSYVYELPIGTGKALLGKASRPVNAIAGGWSVSGIQHYLDGQPISIYGATGIPGKNSSVRYNRVAGQPVKNPNYKNPRTFQPGGSGSDLVTGNSLACETGYFNCNAFYDPNLYQNRDPNGTGTSGEGNPWRFGTMPRNSSDIRGPNYLTEDFGIGKTVPITERIKMELHGEFFDAFNRHIFTRPNSDVGSTTLDNTSNVDAGQITGLQNGPRTIQFRLRITY